MLLKKVVDLVSDVDDNNDDDDEKISGDEWVDLGTASGPSSVPKIVSNNQFTLQAGTYYIRAQAPAYRVDMHHIRLQNMTDSTTAGVGSVGMSSSSFASITLSLLTTRFTISSAKVFEIQHRCSTTHSSYGKGISHGISGTDSIYTIVEIYKES